MSRALGQVARLWGNSIRSLTQRRKGAEGTPGACVRTLSGSYPRLGASASSLLLVASLPCCAASPRGTPDIETLVDATRNIDFDSLDGEFVVEEIEFPQGSGQEQSMVMMRMISGLYLRTALRNEEMAPRLRELFKKKEE